MNNYERYFAQAEGRMKNFLHAEGDGFHNADGFFSNSHNAGGINGATGVDYAEGEMGAEGDMNATGAQVRQMAASMSRTDVSRPYIVNVANTNLVLTNYLLFGSSANRVSATFNEPAGIVVTYGLAGYSYLQLLADSEAKPFTIGRLRLDDTTAGGAPANLTAPLTVSKTSSEGTLFQSPLTPYTALNQFITTAIEIPCNFEVDGDTQIQGSLIASSSVRVSIFPAARASQTRQLNKKPELKGFGRPQIGAIQTIRLTQ